MKSDFFVVNDCEGFEIRVVIDSEKSFDIRNWNEIKTDIKVYVEDALKNRYYLFCQSDKDELLFSRKFFWVDGQYNLFLKVLFQEREECSQRLVVYVSRSNCDQLLSFFRGHLRKVDLGDPDWWTPGQECASVQGAAEALVEAYGVQALEPLHWLVFEKEPQVARAAIRVLTFLNKEISRAPLSQLWREIPVSQEEMLDELRHFFRRQEDPGIVAEFIRAYRENPAGDLRLKALEILAGFQSPEARETLEIAALYDPEPEVRGRARKLLAGDHTPEE